eukprot:1029361-Prorocentrum_minimum.AAC.3
MPTIHTPLFYPLPARPSAAHPRVPPLPAARAPFCCPLPARPSPAPCPRAPLLPATSAPLR